MVGNTWKYLKSCTAVGLFFLPAVTHVCHAQSTTEDQQAFAAARANADPSERASVLRSYLQTFSSGAHHAVAQTLLLELLLSSFPDHTAEIHAVASAQRLSAAPGLERWMEESRLADLLADAEPDGADLADASEWAHDAVSSLTQPAYRHQIAITRARYKLPALTPRQIHKQWADDRARALAALANVSLRQGHPDQAGPLIAESLHLNPLLSEPHRLTAESLLAKGQRAEALGEFIRADALSPLPPRSRKQELNLFSELNHADEAALDRQIDQIYTTLYPPVFALPHRELEHGGHPALLELFTGSDCMPCAGPDLAIDSLLGSYSRSDLIALEFDEHIPRPDPLTVPEGADRATFYAVESTPAAFLDGQPLQILGSTRQDAENIVIGFADQLEDVASLPSGLQVRLTANSPSTSQATAKISLGTAPISAPEPETTGDTSARALERATLYVALVQDDLRYPGKNGIRFHRMVVRALHQEPAAEFLTQPDQPRSVDFDLASIEAKLHTYLSDYQSHNDRFGTFQFPQTDFPLTPDHLAIVAWVQDPTTKLILQSAYTPVTAK